MGRSNWLAVACIVFALSALAGRAIGGPWAYGPSLPHATDDRVMSWGATRATPDVDARWCTTDATHHQWWIDLPPNGTFTVAEDACYDTANDSAGYTELRIQSEDSAAPEEFVGTGHNGTDGVTRVLSGDYYLVSAGGQVLIGNGSGLGELRIYSANDMVQKIAFVEAGAGNERLTIISDPGSTSPQALIGLGEGDARVRNTLILTNKDHDAVAHGHTAAADPTLCGHSNNSPATHPNQWWSVTHDQTNAVLSWDEGVLSLTPGSNGIPAVMLPAVIAAVPAAPAVCSAAYEAVIYYVNVNNDGLPGQWCSCVTTNDVAYDWVQMVDGLPGICP